MIPVPLTKGTGIALLLLIVLFVIGKPMWAVFLLVGWSLGGDGGVFIHVRRMVSGWLQRNRRSA